MRNMDDESLRKQITQQVQADFEEQLREMRREKIGLEEEMEAASQRWRSERRRLNSEIDRLEDALSSRRPDAVEAQEAGEAADTSGLQQAFEENLRKSAAEWAAERQVLKSEIARLEGAVAEAIARSSNPRRTTQSLKDQFEVQLAEADGMRLKVEREFLTARSNWEEEKKKLMAELMKLRRMSPAGGVQIREMMDRLSNRAETVEEARIRELESQLTESRATILRYHDAAMKGSQELANARKEVQGLNQALNEIREQIDSGSIEQLRRQYEANIRELIQRNESLTRELQGSTKGAAGTDSSALQPKPAPAAGSTHMDSEINRIGKAIEAIDQVIDDPDTPASIITRKNVEKSALEAYLRGILFSLGRGEAL
jgi:chromosome segregation ATPase